VALSTYSLTAFSVGMASSESPPNVPSIENSFIVAPLTNVNPSCVNTPAVVEFKTKLIFDVASSIEIYEVPAVSNLVSEAFHHGTLRSIGVFSLVATA